ncbi:MAG: ABC transporter ATP-binding protein [Beijerinckiaceae bacterium]|nr:ABC transporter ATP-binding protein [Beijerinckiaceae bacterium]
MTGHRLRIENVTHRFGSYLAVNAIDLSVAGGEMIALLGPSGCGKSTLLRIISGFIAQNQGRVLFDDEPVDHLKPNRRGTGIVFQNYALFPHMTIADNIAYGLEAQRWDKAKIAPRVKEMLDLVHMSPLADRYPRQLSGGQQQRVALARCLAVDPKILLLDEPFGALDKNLRLDMQIEVKRLQRSYGITTILVTHDQEEALSMADRIAVMNQGRIEQIASPTDIYDRPATLFVNQFVGNANLMTGELLESRSDGATVRLASGDAISTAPAGAMALGSRVTVSIRPERLRIVARGVEGSLPCMVKTVLPLGPQVVYDLETLDRLPLKLIAPRDAAVPHHEAGSTIAVAPVTPTSYLVFALQ